MPTLPTPVLPAQRVFEAVIDQHETWLAVNPVQGCPKDCGYCYLKDRGQTLVKPVELATPEQTVNLLRASPYYHPQAVLALYTCTDALATPPNRAHLIGLLDQLTDSGLRNPVCLITKCAITDDVLAAILRARTAGLPVIVYLSYSGLGPDIERGINHEALRETFPLLHRNGIPVVHYWRPLMPANAAPETITHVMDWTARYAACSVAVGLKVKRGARGQMTELWPELGAEELPLESADAVWPRQTWDLLESLPSRYPGHPIFQTNSCALAYVLQRPDAHRIHATPTCVANHCPAIQRGRCSAAVPVSVTTDDIRSRLAWLGLPTVRSVDWDAEQRTATIQGTLSLRDSNNIAQRFGIAIRAPRDGDDRYWSGRLEGGQPLIIDS
ncbi:radical SAM protein [Streptomyces geranii]|uniref:radical SAM protein n=1 Tax=Streptomyces geranii TaxID=2058923 RepID=UPI001E3D123B|nr:radical SAM protein [Streptomyces geranii]